jgi:hypothetical protein
MHLWSKYQTNPIKSTKLMHVYFKWILWGIFGILLILLHRWLFFKNCYCMIQKPSLHTYGLKLDYYNNNNNQNDTSMFKKNLLNWSAKNYHNLLEKSLWWTSNWVGSKNHLVCEKCSTHHLSMLQGYSTFMDKHHLPPYAIKKNYFRTP